MVLDEAVGAGLQGSPLQASLILTYLSVQKVEQVNLAVTSNERKALILGTRAECPRQESNLCTRFRKLRARSEKCLQARWSERSGRGVRQ